MHFELETGPGHFISAAEPGRVRIGARDYTASLIVTPERIVDDWPVPHIGALGDADMARLREFQPQIVLIGTGASLVFPDVEIYARLLADGIGVEFMNTPAACRTYNLLASERRRVAAGLVITAGTRALSTSERVKRARQ
ncbi:MAG: Mth938-like domain-containing protein [Chromatiales bacterium]|nr:Mth938-like domain-containing protein [Chromatiales bacterium]